MHILINGFFLFFFYYCYYDVYGKDKKKKTFSKIHNNLSDFDFSASCLVLASKQENFGLILGGGLCHKRICFDIAKDT